MHAWQKAIALVLRLASFPLPVANADLGTASTAWITSWNAYSKQFIDPPVFRILPYAGTAEYRTVVKQNDHAWTVLSPS
jgi:hypothetical protein